MPCFKFITGLVLVGASLFLPAGGFAYRNGWLFFSLLFIPMLILWVVLFAKAPDLLQKRLGAKEKESTQKGVVAISGFLFVGSFLITGLDFRFGWSEIPAWVVALASFVLLISYALYAEVMRENSYLSRTVEVQNGQKVINPGLCGIVRHPMYAVTVWFFLAIPIVFRSWWSLLCLFPYVVVIVIRIRNEEKILEHGVEGYTEYRKRVRYRMLPFAW